MKTRRLPGTDLDISVVGMGCWAIGGMWWGDDVDDSTSTRAIHAALDSGINWFDTAPLYGFGRADRVLRDALKGRSERAIIATKVGVRWQEGSDHAQSDLDPVHVVQDTEASLQRLKVDCIDLLQVHWPCENNTPLPETLDALDRLRDQGKIRWYGLCNYESHDIQAASSRPGMVSLQTPYSLLRRELEGELRASCMDAVPAVGILAYEPLCRGLLTGKFKSMPSFPDSDLRAWDDRFQGQRFQHALALVRDLEKVSERVDIPVSALAIGWVLSQDGLTSAIVGAKNPHQVKQNAKGGLLIDRPKVCSVIDRIAALHGGWPR